jgi:UDP-2,3-diacylglucosamine pyrophosphatase LpxH
LNVQDHHHQQQTSTAPVQKILHCNCSSWPLLILPIKFDRR